MKLLKRAEKQSSHENIMNTREKYFDVFLIRFNFVLRRFEKQSFWKVIRSLASSFGKMDHEVDFKKMYLHFWFCGKSFNRFHFQKKRKA